ncbi:MAG: HAMP domain-containing histidine kinase, partial [Pseudonocardia sp.]|nr:HAMP domain-containing histidine kinase [Pseudonocardia sp.]
MTGRAGGPGRLRTRLVLGNVLLVTAALATTLLVTEVTGPPLFHARLLAQGPVPPEVLVRVEQAFRVANLLEVLIAIVIALVLAAAVSPWVTGPVTAAIAAMAAAADRIAAGHRTDRVALMGVSQELDTLAEAFNDMATRIQRTEQTRRRMLGDLAHEMRTPLATIDGYLQANADGVETPDEATLNVLRGQTVRLTRLAQDLHAVSAADENRLTLCRQPCDLREVARTAVDAVQPRYADKGVHLHLAPGRPAPVDADPARLDQVLTNLLGNALRHTPAGGTVEVSVRVAHDWTELVVFDTGEGVAGEHLPHLFERFYRAHPADRYGRTATGGDLRQGSGIGLTI